MESSEIIYLTQTALYLVLMLSMPIIIGATCIGLLIAVLQTIFQVQEQTLSFAGKLFVVTLLFFIIGENMASEIVLFTQQMLDTFKDITR